MWFIFVMETEFSVTYGLRPKKQVTFWKSRLLRNQYRKKYISPFGREVQEMQHVALRERLTRNTLSWSLRYHCNKKNRRENGRAKGPEVYDCGRLRNIYNHSTTRSNYYACAVRECDCHDVGLPHNTLDQNVIPWMSAWDRPWKQNINLVNVMLSHRLRCTER